MRSDPAPATLALPADRAQLAATGAEIVELSERFYRGLFTGMVAFVGVAALAALALLPLRAGPDTGDGMPITVVVTALIALLTPMALRWRGRLFVALRANRGAEIILVALAAALVAYPLRSELWWPACALVMLVAIVAPLRRTLLYCLVVLLTNLAAHVIAGDLDETPAVAILGLWVGFPLWAATFSVIGDRFAAYILRLQITPVPAGGPRPRRVAAWVEGEPSGQEDVGEDQPAPGVRTTKAEGLVTALLTARQLQVAALLIDGLRYREVAACLAITERQVQRHVANAIERAGVKTANELIAIAAAEGLVNRGEAGDGSEPQPGRADASGAQMRTRRVTNPPR